MQTTNYLASLLLAPINSYQSILTLLALPHYAPLLLLQPFSTRRSLSHSIISSILKNETIIETPDDVNGVLDLCQVLIKDQLDSSIPGPQGAPRRQGMHHFDRDEMAEEQGWVARMVHLFRPDSLDVQYEVRVTIVNRFSFANIHVHCYDSYYKRHGDTSKLVGNEFDTHTRPSLQTRLSYVEDTNSANRM